MSGRSVGESEGVGGGWGMKVLVRDYGMLGVLLLLCVFFSLATVTEQKGGGVEGARMVVDRVKGMGVGVTGVLAAVGQGAEEEGFAARLEEGMRQELPRVKLIVSRGEPRDAREAMKRLEAAGEKIQALVLTPATSEWLVFSDLAKDFPGLGHPELVKPMSGKWPNFLKRDNLLNIANQIAVIAILAVGMTLVIVSGGIDLSVGSLIALSAVVSCLLIRDYAGAVSAGGLGMFWCGVAGVVVTACVGAFTGGMITLFRVPPFIVTLGVMLMARGLASRWAEGQAVYQVPDGFTWLGRGVSWVGIPNAVILMLLLYGVAHVVMSRTALGRYLYAVGGNEEAARLAGVPVKRVQWFAYALSGALAGLGGVVMASQLKSASPNYGQMYELYVIAAVVVGGTSLSGGEGRVLGTLIGALIIAVIQNGMNLMNVEAYTQLIVLGGIILLAVLLDRLKRGARV